MAGHSSAFNRPPTRSSRVRGASSLVGMLVSMTILLLLGLASMGLWGPAVSGGGHKRESVPKQVLDRAHDTECTMLLSQFRQSAGSGGMYADPTEQAGPPKSASEIGTPSEMRCPLCGLPYSYDPSKYSDGKYGLHCRYPKHHNL